jgi:hypothetical protein
MPHQGSPSENARCGAGAGFRRLRRQIGLGDGVHELIQPERSLGGAMRDQVLRAKRILAGRT